MATARAGGSLQEDVPGAGVPGPLQCLKSRQQTSGAGALSVAAINRAHTQTSVVGQDSRPRSCVQATAARQCAHCQPEATGGPEASAGQSAQGAQAAQAA